MGLLQNISLRAAQPLKYIGAGAPPGATIIVASTQCMMRSFWNRGDMSMNKFFSSADMDMKGGVPYGYTPPSQFVMAIKEGGMSNYAGIAGAGTFTSRLIMGGNIASGAPRIRGIGSIVANVFLGYYMQADLSGDGDITPSLSGSVQFLANLLGVGSIDPDLGYLAGLGTLLQGASSFDAEMTMPIGMSVAIIGEGAVVANIVGLTFLLADLEGEGTVSADFKSMAQLATGLSGEGDLITPTLKAIAWCVANLLGEGEVDGNSSLRGDAYMSTNITSAGELVTAQTCAAAVWSALAASYNNDGTMGKKMNSAASAGDPWVSEIEGAHTAKDVMRFLLAFISGEATGAGTTTVTFKSDDGTINRIVMTVDSKGNRSSVILDGSD